MNSTKQNEHVGSQYIKTASLKQPLKKDKDLNNKWYLNEG